MSHAAVISTRPLPLVAFRCPPELRSDVEAVARPDETLSDVIRAALADLVEARRHDKIITTGETTS